MIIDCHTHLDEEIGSSGKNSADALLASMDEAGIDSSLVIAETTERNLSNITQVLKATENSPRLYVIANCVYADMGKKGYIEDLISTILKNKKIVGLKFYLGYEQYSPMDSALIPLYNYCQSNNIAVMFHTGVLQSGSAGLLKYSHPLLIDEVANLYPDLKIIMAHMGNPWLIDCAAVVAKNPNVYADVSAFFQENKPIEPNDVAVFKKRMEEVRVFLGNYSKFLFGTDWPLYNQIEYLSAVKSLEMSEAEREAVLWRNAHTIFGIK